MLKYVWMFLGYIQHSRRSSTSSTFSRWKLYSLTTQKDAWASHKYRRILFFHGNGLKAYVCLRWCFASYHGKSPLNNQNNHLFASYHGLHHHFSQPVGEHIWSFFQAPFHQANLRKLPPFRGILPRSNECCKTGHCWWVGSSPCMFAAHPVLYLEAFLNLKDRDAHPEYSLCHKQLLQEGSSCAWPVQNQSTMETTYFWEGALVFSFSFSLSPNSEDFFERCIQEDIKAWITGGPVVKVSAWDNKCAEAVR